jgi:hypothetical protein
MQLLAMLRVQGEISVESKRWGHDMTTTILALTLLWEAGGSPQDLEPVASVIWNRLESGRHGATLEEVCLEPRAFSCWNRREKGLRALQRYADREGHLDAALWFRCVQMAIRIQEGEFEPTTTAILYWKPGARGVKGGMRALREVLRTRAHTYRVEE